MPTREEMREGIARYLYECDDGCFPNAVIVKWEDASDEDKQEYYDRADHILKTEHSQGVVIKVDNGNDLTGCCIARIEPLVVDDD